MTEARAQAPRGGLRQSVRALWQRLRGGELSRGRAAASVALGLFIGSLPIYGLHLPLCLAICVPLRLDAVVAYVAANISNPLIAPFLVTLEIEVGALILTGSTVPFTVEQARKLGVAGFVAQAAVGSVVVGFGLAVLGALLTSLLVRKRGPGATEFEAARTRTIARYHDAAIGERCYVGAKLHTDPLASALGELPNDLGVVLDVGCGRGQFALLLFELGKTKKVSGFDWDARKVAVASVAAKDAAVFHVRDARAGDFAESDTVLLFDVLHYLEHAEQARLLGEIAGALAPGARLFVRELDRDSGVQSGIGRLAERIGARFGYNRAGALAFRPVDELLAQLGALG